VRRPRLWKIVVAVLAVTLVTAALTIALALREGVVKRRVIRALSDHFNSDVTIGSMSVSVYPTVRIVAEGLTVRRRMDPADQPPLIEAARFTVEPGIWHLLQRRAKHVEVEGLRVTIPRRPATRASLVDVGDDSGQARDPGKEKDTAPAQLPRPAAAGRKFRGILDRVVARNAELIYSSRRPDRPPRVIRVHEVELTDVSFDNPMRYRTTLTNPVPEGRLETSGIFGPLDANDPGRSPVEGSYVLTGADFNTIKGLSGTVAK